MSATSRPRIPRACGSGGLARFTAAPSKRSATPNSAEQQAARWYRLRGWRILGANVWVGGNELDLIVRRGRRLAFVEVKGKSSGRRGDPLEMVGAEKQRRIRRAAGTWLALHRERASLRVFVDVV